MKNANDLLLTSGNPARRIVAFALPLLVGEFFYIFYGMADTFIVGRWLGINGLAAVGVSYSLIMFVWGFVVGLTSGFVVITAQQAGAGNEQGIRRSVASGLILSLIISIVLTAIILPVIPHILGWMRTPPEITADSASYLFITFAGIIVFMFINMLTGIIFAGGDSLNPLIFVSVGAVCNIIFDILFVAVFSWGIRGAALATVFSQLLTAALTLRFIFARFRNFLPRREDWRITRSEIGSHLSLGIAMALQRSIVEVGNILVQAAINSLGPMTIAAVSAAQRVRGLNMLPLFALSRAVTTYTAQNFGAGKMERIYQGIFHACVISLGLGAFMALLNQFIGAPIVSLFLVDSPEAIALAKQYVLITGYTVFILGIMLVFRSCLQGLGKKTAPILCGVMETAMSILAAFVLIPYLGFLGVCLVNPLSWLASGIPLYIAFGVLRRKLANVKQI